MDCSPHEEVNWSPHQPARGLYRRLFLKRCPGLKPNQVLPRIVCRADAVDVRADHLSAYQSVIGMTAGMTADAGAPVPLMYPHALLGSAHLLIISHPSFPLRAMGLLHLRNHVFQHRPFDIKRPWDLHCELTRQRHVEKGLEFDFDATVTVDGEVVWHSISTYLKRAEPLGEVENSPLQDLFPPLDEDAQEAGQFPVPPDIGKRYAKVTGDYNPIHVSSLAAKLFGFKRAIAHGMWSVARAIRELPAIDGPIRHDVSFKGPMLVGSQATTKTGQHDRFDVFCGSNPRPVIVGVWRTATAEDRLQ